jgi:hypothetical protein
METPLILDNHAAHISKETRAWLARQPEGRFAFTFTPRHGSWLNLRLLFQACAIRAAAHPGRLQTGTEREDLGCHKRLSHHPVVHTWPYKLNQAA